jgi:hypothetical protein
MSRKKKPQEPNPPVQDRPVSELALMLGGCQDAAAWPVLADYLEEKLGLSATATLLRSPDLVAAPGEFVDASAFDYYPLGADVFLWLADGRYSAGRSRRVARPGTLVGLYAHPPGQEEHWVKVTRVLPREETSDRSPGMPWVKLRRPEPRLDRLKEELARFARRLPS